jgi:hypothetical protein
MNLEIPKRLLIWDIGSTILFSMESLSSNTVHIETKPTKKIYGTRPSFQLNMTQKQHSH